MTTHNLPPADQKEKNHFFKSDYTKVFVGGAAFILSIILYALEVAHFNNTFEVKSLLFMALVTGVFFGTLIGDQFKKYADSPIEVFQIYTIVIILTLILMPLLISLSNRLLNFNEPTLQSVEFVKCEPYIESRYGVLPNQKVDGYFTFFIYKGEVHRIKTKEKPFLEAKERDRVKIPINKGIWQFEWVAF